MRKFSIDVNGQKIVDYDTKCTEVTFSISDSVKDGWFFVTINRGEFKECKMINLVDIETFEMKMEDK